MVTVTSPLAAICTKADGCCCRLEGAGRLAGTGLCHCQVRKGAERQAAGTGQLQEAAARQRGGFVGLAAGQQVLQARGSSL